MQQEKENQLGIEASNMYLRNQDILRSELDENADWQQKAWDWDKRMPYENTANAIGALRESSARNFDTAWKDLTGGISNLAMGEYLRGAGGLDLGDTTKAIDPNSPNNPAFKMLTDPNQNGPTQGLIGAGSLTNDQAFKINRKPVFDAFNLGGYSPQFTSR